MAVQLLNFPTASILSEFYWPYSAWVIYFAITLPLLDLTPHFMSYIRYYLTTADVTRHCQRALPATHCHPVEYSVLHTLTSCQAVKAGRNTLSTILILLALQVKQKPGRCINPSRVLFELQSLFGPHFEGEEFTFSGRLPLALQWLLCGQEECFRNSQCGWSNGGLIYWSQWDDLCTVANACFLPSVRPKQTN